MKIEKFTYEIVVNVGNYQSIRIGGEWSVFEAPTTEQVIEIDAELRQKVAEVVESRKAQPQPQSENKENKENKPENKLEKPVDTSLEFVPSNLPKFLFIL